MTVEKNAHTARAIWLRLLVAVIAIIATGVIWLSAGRAITSVADAVVTVAVPAPAAKQITYDGEGFRIGGLSLTFGTLNNYPFDLGLNTNASNMVVLTTKGGPFILGPRSNPVDRSGRPDIRLVPERGDKVTLTAARSLVGWPTPFEYTIMISNPSWKRYVYYRLVWHKRSGAELVMRWRYEQDYFSGRGWIRPTMMWDFHTGLITVASG